MTINFSFITPLLNRLERLSLFKLSVIIAVISAVLATLYSYFHHYIIAYGDAESHLNIAKRVVSSLTPGMAQLGGIWPPLPHLMMIPFVYNDFLWRSGLAGSIVSGICYLITGIYLFKFTELLTGSRVASFIAFLVFAFNPNVLYMQSTPMTELPLLVFFMLSSYYFVRFIKDDREFLSLIFAALFAFCASLSRYDGWFLVLVEAAVLIVMYGLPRKAKELRKTTGKLVLFSSLAFFGIFLWLLWDFLILGDPLYFTNSQFSAKSQQQSWLARGELPAYKHIVTSTVYYFVTAMSNAGVILFSIAIVGLLYYLIREKKKEKWFISLILLVPFIFYVVTQYVGQSVIFIPSITPSTFDWRLFNVRYGLMMVPTVAFFIGYLFSKGRNAARLLILTLFFCQIGLFLIGYSPVITLADGTVGLSAEKTADAQQWLDKHYDYGLILLDDFARTVSITKAGIPMQKVIYVGNKPYWEESLEKPEKYARWIVIQKDDAVWKGIYENPARQAELYKYFVKAYTSPNILIFKRNDNVF